MLYNTEIIIKLDQTATDFTVSHSLSERASGYWRIGELGVGQNWGDNIL